MRTENTLLKAISTLCTQDREQAKDHLAQELRFSFFCFLSFFSYVAHFDWKGFKKPVTAQQNEGNYEERRNQ